MFNSINMKNFIYTRTILINRENNGSFPTLRLRSIMIKSLTRHLRNSGLHEKEGVVRYYMSLRRVRASRASLRERERGRRNSFFLRSSTSFLKDDDGKRRAEQSSWRRLNKSHYKLASCWLSSSTKLTNSLYIKTNRPPRHPPGRAPRLI